MRGLRRHRLADRQVARVVVGAVAEVLEHVRHLGEHRVRDPVDALAAHLDQALGVAVHPRRHEVAADAGLRARALGHLGAGVVRAAGAEVGQALDRVAGVGQQLRRREVAHQVAPVEVAGSARASQSATISIRRDGRSSPSARTSGAPCASRLPTIAGRTARVVEQVAQLLPRPPAPFSSIDQDLAQAARRTRRMRVGSSG